MKALWLATVFCSIHLMNARVISNLNEILNYIDSETYLVSDLDGVLIDIARNNLLLNDANSMLQQAQQKCKAVHCVTKATLEGDDPYVLINTLKGYGITFNPILDLGILQKLHILGAVHVKGIVYAGRASKGKIIATLFGDGKNVIFVDDSLSHIESVEKECPKAIALHLVSER